MATATPRGDEGMIMRDHGSRRLGVGASALTLTAVLLSSCGSDAGDEGSGDELVIGALINVTGPTTTGEASAPDVLKGWAKNLNAEGGIGGHHVTIDVVDTKGDAPTASAAVRRFASDESVVGAIIFDASTEGVVAEAINDAGLPVIGGIGYNPTAWGALDNWLPLTTTFPAVINMGMVIGQNYGAKTAVFPVCAENPSCAAAGPLAEGAAQALGMTYAGTLPVPVSSPDFTAECLKVTGDDVDFVLLGLTTAASLRLVDDCKTQGYEGKWGLFDGSVWPKVMKENDPGVEIGIAINAFPWWVDDAPVERYRSEMEKAGVAEDSWGSPQGTAAYVTMEVFEKALSGADLSAHPTRDEVVEAYGSIEGETLDGLLPQPITFVPGEPQALVKCFWLATYEDGEFSGSELMEPTCDTVPAAS